MKSGFKLFFIVVCFLFTVRSFAETSVAAKLDTNVIVIGDQVKLTITAKHPENRKVVFATLPDTLGKIEILSRSKIDTIRVQNEKEITEKQTFILTGFDSGYFALPPIPFLMANDRGTMDTVQTDPFLLTVRTVSVDTAFASVRDIKKPLDVPFNWKDFILYIIGGIVLLLIIAGLIYYFRTKKKPVVEVKRKIPARPAHEIAFEELDKLHDEKLWQQGKVKLYYSRLTDIVRQYIDHRFGIYAMEKTTDEIMDSFHDDRISHELKIKLKTMLELADFVKFAKVQPLPDENQKGMDDAYSFVKETLKKTAEEESKKEETKEV